MLKNNGETEGSEQGREIQDNFRIFFDLCPDFLFVLDMEGNIILANRTVLELLEYSNAELKGMSVLLLHPEGRREEAGRIVAGMIEGSLDACPVPLFSRSGREIPVETRVVAGNWNGEPCLFGYSRNLSEWKQSEEKFRSAFESSSVLMAISTLEEGRFLDVNQAFLDALLLERGQVLGRTSQELGIFEDAGVRQEMIRSFREEGAIVNREVLIREGKGKTLNGLFSASLLKGSSGEELLLTVMNDITELKDTERRLRESEERLQLAMLAADLGAWDWNVATGEVHFDRRWAEMLGYELEEIETRVETWEKLLHPEDTSHVTEALQNHLNGKSDAYRTEHRLRSKTGAWVWILDSGRVIQRDAAGAPLRMVGIHLDISDRKAAEAELLRRREQLEDLVLDRTRRLEEAQKELLTRALEAGRAQALDIMLHNIGNAVTPILLQTDKLNVCDKDAPVKYLKACYQELYSHRGDLDGYISRNSRGRDIFAFMGKLLNELVEGTCQKNRDSVAAIRNSVWQISSILKAQSLSMGKEGMREQVGLAGLVENVLQIQGPSLEKRGIRVRTEMDPNVMIRADRSSMVQVIMNLLKNAYEAIDPRGVEDSLREIVIRASKEGGRVCLEISDTGTGIESDHLESVFEARVSGKGSSGFGLFYCRNVVEANDGTIVVASEGKEKGTLVRMEFDAAPEWDGCEVS